MTPVDQLMGAISGRILLHGGPLDGESVRSFKWPNGEAMIACGGDVGIRFAVYQITGVGEATFVRFAEQQPLTGKSHEVTLPSGEKMSGGRWMARKAESGEAVK